MEDKTGFDIKKVMTDWQEIRNQFVTIIATINQERDDIVTEICQLVERSNGNQDEIFKLVLFLNYCCMFSTRNFKALKFTFESRKPEIWNTLLRAGLRVHGIQSCADTRRLINLQASLKELKDRLGQLENFAEHALAETEAKKIKE